MTIWKVLPILVAVVTCCQQAVGQTDDRFRALAATPFVESVAAYSSSPAMAMNIVGMGAKYPTTFRDADGDILSGSKSYKLHLPPGIPAKLFWSVTVYDTDTASGLDNGQPLPSINSMDQPETTCQAYLWAIPLMGFAQWQATVEDVIGAKDGDLVVYASYQDKLGVLTANATTPYLGGFINLSRTGPLVIDVPAGQIAGFIMDLWQSEIMRFRRSRCSARSCSAGEARPFAEVPSTQPYGLGYANIRGFAPEENERVTSTQ